MSLYTVIVRAEFNAAHKLRDYRGKCESLHGHNWSVDVTVGSKKLNKIGMVMDFTELKRAVYILLENLDHKFLNELEPFKKINPTSENIARYIYNGLKKVCKKHKVKLMNVMVGETPTSAAIYEE